ncbi:MAG: MFS transporter [Candidatus Bathyarchaeota archaeon]|nr:MAG: MFS transporter [Candidatus Bathyarchaeota archaeon]
MAIQTRFLDSLRNPTFRLLWSSSLLQNICRNIQMILLSWLVLEITDSPVLVGGVQALRMVPNIFGVFGGIIADRIGDRRKLLFSIVSMNIVFSFIFGGLVLLQKIEVWHIVVLTLLQNTANVLQMPTRQVFSIDILGAKRIPNAVTLNTLAFRLSSLIGSSLIGGLISSFGIGSFYVYTGLLYLVSSILLIFIKVKRESAPAMEKISILTDVREGLQYVKRSKEILGLQLIAVAANLFGFPLTNTLLPIFARDVLLVGADGLGWLISASSAGAFLSVMYITLREPQRKGRFLTYSSIGWGLTLALLSFARIFSMSSICLFAVGITNSMSMVMVSTLLMMFSVEQMRGRVMGVRMLAVFPLSIGNLLAGLLANSIGVSATLFLQGVLFIASVSGIFLYVPALGTFRSHEAS